MVWQSRGSGALPEWAATPQLPSSPPPGHWPPTPLQQRRTQRRQPRQRLWRRQHRNRPRAVGRARGKQPNDAVRSRLPGLPPARTCATTAAAPAGPVAHRAPAAAVAAGGRARPLVETRRPEQLQLICQAAKSAPQTASARGTARTRARPTDVPRAPRRREARHRQARHRHLPSPSAPARPLQGHPSSGPSSEPSLGPSSRATAASCAKKPSWKLQGPPPLQLAITPCR
mmetsp:Transcript_62163/g.178348  ORF Transcript_62163/g.178348 Transcript_62163/m.178348 type:complete len:229 (-) Transcript_62163:677-1363(-)